MNGRRWGILISYLIVLGIGGLALGFANLRRGLFLLLFILSHAFSHDFFQITLGLLLLWGAHYLLIRYTCRWGPIRAIGVAWVLTGAVAVMALSWVPIHH